MNKKVLYRTTLLALITILLFGFFKSEQASAQTDTPSHPVTIYLFWGEGCPHCAKALPYLESLPAKYPGVSLETYEVYYDPFNNVVFEQTIKLLALDAALVPTVVIGPYYMQGYSEAANIAIEETLQKCLAEGCPDVIRELLVKGMANPTSIITSSISGQSELLPGDTEPAVDDCGEIGGSESNFIELPILGYVDLSSLSLGVSTALIALVDGFNPCSLWALSMLLAITIHTGSRKKIFLIGMVFIFVTALIYALFIAGLFSVLKFAGLITWMRVVVFIVAAILGIINIKDYFWFKEGISLTIDDSRRKGILQRMRKLLDGSQSTGSLIGATILLAGGVSLVEFSCTAGLPVLWTNLLNAQGVATGTFILLLLLYLVIYQADELVIFFVAVSTLKASKLEEKHGRILKLAGGILMLTLAVVMLVNPSWMNELGSSLIVFGAALGIFLMVLLVHRVILPRLGINIGSENLSK